VNAKQVPVFLLSLLALQMPLIGQSVLGEFQPITAHTSLYFPHVVDGGSPAQQWQARISLVNTGLTTASVAVFFYADDGSGWPVDFGSGPSNEVHVTLPPQGSTILISKSSSATIKTGWAFAASNVPVQGTLTLRYFQSGKTMLELTTEPTLPSIAYSSPATSLLGVAIANVYSDSPISVTLNVADRNGLIVGHAMVSVPPFGHTSFNLRDKIPSLGDSFTGSLYMTTSDNSEFIAWTLFADQSGVISTLPNGRLSWPISHWDEIWEVFLKAWDRAQAIDASGAMPGKFGKTPPSLKIVASYNGQAINAFGNADSVIVTYGLSELISDSPSELAFAVAHEMGHVYQYRNGGQLLFDSDPEFDADTWGLLLSLSAGYDPYAAAGTLAKLSMATGQAGLVQQFEAQLSSDAHKSFNQRLDSLFNAISQTCADPSIQAFCQRYKNIVHPDLPGSVPLMVHPHRDNTTRGLK